MQGSLPQPNPPSANSAQPRWRFQYSLRTLHLVVLAVSIACIPFAMKTKAIRLEKAAKYHIETFGGKATYVPRCEWSWFMWILGHEAAPHHTYIDLHHCHLDDETGAHIEQFQEVRSLELSETQVTDDGLRRLASLRDLDNLSVYKTALSDRALVYLETLPKLQSLSLFGTQVTDEGCRTLARMTSLSRVSLGWNKVTPAGVAWLRKARPDIEVEYEPPSAATNEEDLTNSQESTP